MTQGSNDVNIQVINPSERCSNNGNADDGTRTSTIETVPAVTMNHKTWPNLPSWAEVDQRQTWGERLRVNEWEGVSGTGDDLADIDQYRRDNGWKVSFILSVRVLKPYVIAVFFSLSFQCMNESCGSGNVYGFHFLCK